MVPPPRGEGQEKRRLCSRSTAGFHRKINASGALILRRSRRRMLSSPRRTGKGAWPATDAAARGDRAGLVGSACVGCPRAETEGEGRKLDHRGLHAGRPRPSWGSLRSLSSHSRLWFKRCTVRQGITGWGEGRKRPARPGLADNGSTRSARLRRNGIKLKATPGEARALRTLPIAASRRVSDSPRPGLGTGACACPRPRAKAGCLAEKAF